MTLPIYGRIPQASLLLISWSFSQHFQVEDSKLRISSPILALYSLGYIWAPSRGSTQLFSNPTHGLPNHVFTVVSLIVYVAFRPEAMQSQSPASCCLLAVSPETNSARSLSHTVLYFRYSLCSLSLNF
jgi:hypothetical protein